jgi:hypothetical protein
MKKAPNYLRIFIISFAVLGIIYLLYMTHQGNVKNFHYSFNGKVKMVSYDVKGEATVFINDTNYYLSYPNWDFDHNRIEVGDSMIKQSKSWVIKLIRSNGQVIIEGSDEH